MTESSPNNREPVVFPETAERERFTKAGALAGLIYGILTTVLICCAFAAIWLIVIVPLFFGGK